MMQEKPRLPVATIAIIVVLVVIAILVMLSPDSDALLLAGANKPAAAREHGEVYRLITSMFLHAGLLHLLINVNLLYLLGLPLERCIGHRSFMLIFLLSGLIGGFFHALFAPIGANGLGVSTALYGLLGANALELHHRRRTLSQPERFYLYGIIGLGAAGIAVGIGLNALDAPLQAGNWGHLGGLLSGVVLGYWLTNEKRLA